MENYQTTGRNELFITTSSSKNVQVNISSPRWFSPYIDHSFIITSGIIKHITIPTALRMIGTSLTAKGILIEASDEIVAYGSNTVVYSNDGFLALPVDVIGSEYFVTGYFPTGYTYDAEFAIVGAHDVTRISIKLGKYLSSYVSYNGMKYYKNQWLNLTINAYDTLQIQSLGELCGTYVLADKQISLFSGNKLSAIPETGAGDHLVEQQIPVDKWGKSFATIPIPGRIVGDKFRFLASESRTTVQVNGYDNGTPLSYSFMLDSYGDWVERHFSSHMYALIKSDKPILLVQFSVSQVDDSRPSDPSMIIVPPIELYSANYVFTTPKSASLSSYKNYFMFVIKSVDKDGLRINGKRLTTTLHNFPGGEYVGGSLFLPEGVYDIRHISPICVFMGILYGTGTFETYGFPVGLRMASINTVCNITNSIPSDGIDNDCDGKIDEELKNNKDDDGDGLTDEDIAGFYTDNPCFATPCFNGGTCTDSDDNYTCTCVTEYDPLTDCQTKLDACVNMPCIYGNCTNYFTNYTCSCHMGYTGANCQTDINECRSSPCRHGSCIDKVNGYTCDCQLFYTGDTCKQVSLFPLLLSIAMTTIVISGLIFFAIIWGRKMKAANTAPFPFQDIILGQSKSYFKAPKIQMVHANGE